MIRRPLQLLAALYAVLVIVVATWAFCTDIAMAASSTEHLLPDITLALVCMPASLSLSAIATAFPGHFDTELTQVAWVTFCGLLQATCLFLAARAIGGRTSRPQD